MKSIIFFNVLTYYSVKYLNLPCFKRSANDFLKQLSFENYGRFHRSNKSDSDIHLFAHKILTEGVQENYVIKILIFIWVLLLYILILY